MLQTSQATVLGNQEKSVDIIEKWGVGIYLVHFLPRGIVGKHNSPMEKSLSQASGKKALRPIRQKGNLCETGWEREIKGNFVFPTSYNCTVR